MLIQKDLMACETMGDVVDLVNIANSFYVAATYAVNCVKTCANFIVMTTVENHLNVLKENGAIFNIDHALNYSNYITGQSFIPGRFLKNNEIKAETIT